jgi:hypothetical protein
MPKCRQKPGHAAKRFFQGLEKFPREFPRLGKTAGSSFQALEFGWEVVVAPGGLAPPERKFCG